MAVAGGLSLAGVVLSSPARTGPAGVPYHRVQAMTYLVQHMAVAGGLPLAAVVLSSPARTGPAGVP